MLNRNQIWRLVYRAIPQHGARPSVYGPSVCSRCIIRVLIMHNLCRFSSKKLFVQQNVSFERAKGRVVIEIAKVMAEKGVPPVPEGERGLQLPSDRENGIRAIRGQRDWLRGITARSSHERL